MSGTAETHEYHLERIVKKMLNERGFPEIVEDSDDEDDPYMVVTSAKLSMSSH